MKVKTKLTFIDLQEDTQRKAGEEFEVTAERFSELSERLPGYLLVVEKEEKVKEEQKVQKEKAVTKVRKPRATRKTKKTE